jgi:hypothetical protein
MGFIANVSEVVSIEHQQHTGICSGLGILIGCQKYLSLSKPGNGYGQTEY